MNPHSRISTSFSPLLWLAPVPFVLAMCLPVEPRTGAAAARGEPAAADAAQTVAQAASSTRAYPR